jgi:DivIVA domain-containing protein
MLVSRCDPARSACDDQRVIWVLLTAVAVLLVGVVGAMLAGWIRYDPMPDPVTSQPDPGLPEAFTARDIEGVHFDTALRGYRMDQVDRVLDALQDRIAEQESQLEALRGQEEGLAASPQEPGV